MKTKPHTLLLHPAFLAGLVVLLLNDFYLKYTFHNELTGKLSDFAGLFVFAVFLFVVFPPYKQHVIIFCVLLFCWWKSPLSSPFIQFVNSRLLLPMHRTIDYTDLFALLILPFTYLIKPPGYQASVIRSVAVYTAGIVAFFSFCATTMVPRPLAYHPYRRNEVRFHEYFNSSLSKEEVLAKLNPEHIGYKVDSVKFYKIHEAGTFFQRVNSAPDSIYPSIYVANNKDTSLFVRKTEGEFYTLPRYLLEGDTLLNLEFRIFNTGKHKRPTRVWIESYQATNTGPVPVYYNSALTKRYKKHFRRLFRE
jgi:hypothetical protein